jgi:poly(A) polymerase
VLDAEGLAACTRAAGTLAALSAERVGAEMLKMLALPKVAATIEAMAGAGVLDFSARLLGLLVDYEAISLAPSREVRLALIAAVIGVDVLQKRWRLSNETAKGLEVVITSAGLVAGGKLNEAAYRFGAAASAAVEMAAVVSGWNRARADAVQAAADAIVVPEFPLSGAVMLKAGFVPGKSLGEELARLERLWIESGFTLDREGLLEMVEPGSAAHRRSPHPP